ncbi:MAG TPA: cupin domain-containing protein [Gemmataceae bacterium]
MVRLNRRGRMGAVAPANAGRGRLRRRPHSRLDRLPHVVADRGGAHHRHKAIGGEAGRGGTLTTSYTHFSNLAKELQPADKSILSHTLFSDDRLKIVVFGFAQGEELTEHTASMPAVLHFLQGKAAVTLGDDRHEARPGTWVHMPTGLRHGVQAKMPVVMLPMLLM